MFTLTAAEGWTYQNFLPDGLEQRLMRERDQPFIRATWMRRFWPKFKRGEGWADKTRRSCEDASRSQNWKLLEVIYQREMPAKINAALKVNTTTCVYETEAPDYVVAWVSSTPSGTVEMCHSIDEVRTELEPILYRMGMK